MIHETDGELRKWIEGVGKDVEISMELTSAPAEGERVSAYLYEIAPKPRPRGDRRPPLQLEARYLVTAFAPETKRAHELVSELIFAAMQAAEYEVDPSPPPLALWSALGVAPRPGFVLKAKVHKTLPDAEVKPVLKTAGRAAGGRLVPARARRHSGRRPGRRSIRRDCDARDAHPHRLPRALRVPRRS